MYNLRFYLDDNDNVIKCDYKQIVGNNELDSMFYNDLMLNKNDLKRAFMSLANHDLNHKYAIQPNYILHEFVVPSTVINDLKEKMKIYKNELEQELAARRTTSKFNNAEVNSSEPKKSKHGKYIIRRENKYKRRRVIASILVLATLSTAIYGGVKVTQSIASALDKTDSIVQEYSEDSTHQLSAAQMAELIEEEKYKQAQETSNVEQANQVSEPIEVASSSTENKESFVDEKYDYEVNINTEDWTGSQKYIDCYNNYYPLIEKYAKMYGIDPNYALAIACHERGEHSDRVDSGGGLGLYQVQIVGGFNWQGKTVRAFNFETNEWEDYVIYQDNIKNLEENIKAGMMILQKCLVNDDYNVTMGAQEYNFGHTGLMTAINAASNALGESVDTLTQNDNTDWFDYRTYNVSSDGYQMGDPNYVENVFKYINNDEIMNFTKPDGEQISVKYHNMSYDLVRG